jgi:hypothetical protein
MSGAAVFVSRWSGTLGFADPRERLGAPTAILDPLVSVLYEIDGKLVERIAAADPAAADLIADVRRRRSIAKLPDAEHRVALVVALFERVLVPAAVGSDRWYGACQRYLELLYAFDDAQRQISDAGCWALKR